MSLGKQVCKSHAKQDKAKDADTYAPKSKKRRGNPAAKDHWLKGSLLARQKLMPAPASSKLPSVPKKGTDYYQTAKDYAAKLKSGEISAARCEELLAIDSKCTEG